MAHFRYVIPIGKQHLWVEGDAKTNAALFAQVAELADVFPTDCGHCGCAELVPRTFRGQYVSYEIACRACGYRLRINSRKDGGLYVKERTWVEPYQKEGAATNGNEPGEPPESSDAVPDGERTLY